MPTPDTLIILVAGLIMGALLHRGVFCKSKPYPDITGWPIWTEDFQGLEKLCDKFDTSYQFPDPNGDTVEVHYDEDHLLLVTRDHKGRLTGRYFFV